MNKRTAEMILELSKPYDYPSLRRRWRKLCSEYHPDKAATTGMDAGAGDDVLKDLNEAFTTLKPYVQDGRLVDPERSGFDVPFADEEYRRQESNRSDREDPREAIYLIASLALMTARTSGDLRAAAEMFKSLGAYKDAAWLYEACKDKAGHMESVAEDEPQGRQTNAPRTRHLGAGWNPDTWDSSLSESSLNLSDELLFAAAFMAVLADEHVIDDDRRQGEFDGAIDKCLEVLDGILDIKGMFTPGFRESFDRAGLIDSIASSATFDQLCTAPFYHMFRATYASFLYEAPEVFHRVYSAFDEITDVYAEFVWRDYEEMVTRALGEYEGLADLIEASADAIDNRMRLTDPDYFEG